MFLFYIYIHIYIYIYIHIYEIMKEFLKEREVKDIHIYIGNISIYKYI